MLTSDKSVVKQHEADEDAIKDSEGYKKPVERVLHLLTGKDDDGKDTSNQTKNSNGKLKQNKISMNMTCL